MELLRFSPSTMPLGQIGTIVFHVFNQSSMHRFAFACPARLLPGS